MYSAAWHQLIECAGCATLIAPRLDRSYVVGASSYLCYGCAIARGGVYDFQHERWVVLPDAEARDENDDEQGDDPL